MRQVLLLLPASLQNGLLEGAAASVAGGASVGAAAGVAVAAVAPTVAAMILGIAVVAAAVPLPTVAAEVVAMSCCPLGLWCVNFCRIQDPVQLYVQYVDVLQL
jgi:hypothetical protein